MRVFCLYLGKNAVFSISLLFRYKCMFSLFLGENACFLLFFLQKCMFFACFGKKVVFFASKARFAYVVFACIWVKEGIFSFSLLLEQKCMFFLFFWEKCVFCFFFFCRNPCFLLSRFLLTNAWFLLVLG